MTTNNVTAISETEVSSKPRRRSFTREYKLSILERADRCSSSGDIGKLLRQEGLYSSHLASWRRQRRAGTLRALGRKRGPKKAKSAEQLENVLRLYPRSNVKLGVMDAPGFSVGAFAEEVADWLGLAPFALSNEELKPRNVSSMPRIERIVTTAW